MQTTESTAPQDQSGRQDAEAPTPEVEEAVRHQDAEAPTPEVEEAVRQRAEWARQAVPELATAGRVRKDAVLRHMAEALRANAAAIITANREDRSRGREAGTSAAMLDRLKLDEARVEALAL
ncbi:MAG: hypothetical protein DI545_02460, partial [Micrococcus luteus]